MKKSLFSDQGGKQKLKVGIAGAGWYGCHIAIELKKIGYQVTLIEEKDRIFSKVSGNFGVRVHAGPHYPRSKATRVSTQKSFEIFHREYPDVILTTDNSIYSLGNRDAAGLDPKVNKTEFKKVCNENIIKMQTDNPSEWGFNNLLYAAKIYEPSAFVGNIVREKLEKRLLEHSISISYNTKITGVKIKENKISVYCDNKFFSNFDYLVNATGFQERCLIPKNIKFPFEVKYQACIGLIFKDLYPEPNLGKMSFIVLDGSFPCMMPYVGSHKNPNQYLLTHGAWTILGTRDTPEEANQLIVSLTSDDIKKIRLEVTSAMTNFYPAFKQKYRYVDFKSGVLAKLRTEKEFRSSIVFKTGKIIHVFPGKISNIFDAAKETKQILREEKVIEHQNGFSYVRGGVFDKGMSEITELPDPDDKRNTCSLQTLEEKIRSPSSISNNKSSLFNIITKREKEQLKNRNFTASL